MEWGPPKVRLSVPPQDGVHLLAWGSDPAGRWWALVTWERWMAHRFEAPVQMWCTAWTAARHVAEVEYEDYGRVPRVRLDADPRWWPTPPPNSKLGHYGVIDAHAALDAPAGWRWCSPRYSKRSRS